MDKFESFSVEDIRKVRTAEAEKMKGMNAKERINYINKGAEKGKKRIEELRKTKVAI